MTYERFQKVILNLQKQDLIVGKLYKLNIDTIHYNEPYNIIIAELITEIYGEEGYGWFAWFCYENDFGHGELTATDEDMKPIAHSFESLWELLELNHKVK